MSDFENFLIISFPDAFLSGSTWNFRVPVVSSPCHIPALNVGLLKPDSILNVMESVYLPESAKTIVLS